MSEREQKEVAVETQQRRRRLGPNPRPPSQWGTPDTRGGLGPRGISPMPPSQWAPPVAGGSLGFGGNTVQRKSALDIANELAAQEVSRPRIPTPDLLALAATNMQANQQQVPTGPTTADWIAQNMGVFDPSPYQFDSTPYDNYLNTLIQQDEETMARINAMYAQLAENAGANMERIGEVYDAGTAALGDVYGSAYGGVEDAYGSAQQQAADQMARLGIEAAAPAVIDPMALSQAEALSGIESQRSSGLGSTQQYRTSAQDFGSQMEQVAQQQGLEVSSQILAQMAQRQAEAAFMRQQAEADATSRLQQAQANFNPYANLLQEMEIEQMRNEPVLRAEQQAREQAFEMAKLEIERRMQFDEGLRRDVQRFMDQGLDYDQAVEAVMNLTGYDPYTN